MRESILTIPIHEVFEPNDGCPFCRMRDMLEQRCIEFIMGAAMMEPNVRIETNEQGFCITHYNMMLKAENRLSLALMLSTHIDEIRKSDFEKKNIFDSKKPKLYKLARTYNDCFVCNQIDKNMQRLMTTFFEMFSKDEAFRKLFESQKTICLPHYEMIMSMSEKKLKKDMLPVFQKICTDIVKRNLDELYTDTCHFIKMYDYRNTGKDADWGNSKDSIERTIKFLTTR